MNTVFFEQDIKIFYVTATSFPEGVMDAHRKLKALVPFSDARIYFGISRPEQGGAIVYRAGTSEKFGGEAAVYSGDTLILKSGKYVCITVTDYTSDTQRIGRAFQELLNYPGLYPAGYCVEQYENDRDAVACMIRLAD